MSRICLYFRPLPERDRWVAGDRFVRPYIRRMIRGRPRPGGVDKVFINLCLGLNRLRVPYTINLPFREIKGGDRVGVIGCGRHVLAGYDRPNPIVAGVAMMSHPSAWPSFCDEYPVAAYLQHSAWASDVYRPYFGDRVRIWPVGIDTDTWRPVSRGKPEFDFLIYDKVMWNRQESPLVSQISKELEKRGLTFSTISYGNYDENRYKLALSQCRYMVFLCEHESQGLAYLEALASGVPVLAWDQGWCLDPDRYSWGQPDIPATSVPYFDDRCGLRFADLDEFSRRMDEFLDCDRDGRFAPRSYVLENLTVEACSGRYVELLNGAAGCGL